MHVHDSNSMTSTVRNHFCPKVEVLECQEKCRSEKIMLKNILSTELFIQEG